MKTKQNKSKSKQIQTNPNKSKSNRNQVKIKSKSNQNKSKQIQTNQHQNKSKDPEIVPINALEKIATLAGPPEYRPAITIAKSMNNCPRPMRVARTPNRMKRNTYCAMTPIAMP